MHLLAPEYTLHEQIVTASDMYSLGCVIYAVHAKACLVSFTEWVWEVISCARRVLPLSRITIALLP